MYTFLYYFGIYRWTKTLNANKKKIKQEGHDGPGSLTLIKQCNAMQNTSRQLFWQKKSFILYFFYLIWPIIQHVLDIIEDQLSDQVSTCSK